MAPFTSPLNTPWMPNPSSPSARSIESGNNRSPSPTKSRNSVAFTDDVSILRSSSTTHFRHLSTQNSSPSSNAMRNDAFFIPGVSDSKEDVAGKLFPRLLLLLL